MNLIADTTPELKAWRNEVRAFLDQELPEDVHFHWDFDEDDQGWEDLAKFWRKVGARGWIGLTWSREYYGLGRTATEKWILMEEFCRRNVPEYPGIGLNVANFIGRLGTHEQRRKHLRGIASAEVFWGEGFTEPDAGSDLASLRTSAAPDGDGWILQGQKTFATAAHRTSWLVVLARTDPNVPKHAGISCFLVPADAPGVTLQPLYNIAGGRQNHIFLDQVRVEADQLLGDVNRAWQQVWFRKGGTLIDAGGPAPSIRTNRLRTILEMMLEYCQETKRDGQPLIDHPEVRARLADMVIGVEALKVLEYDDFSRFSHAEASPLEPFLTRVVFKEFQPAFVRSCMEILGPLAQIEEGRWAPLAGAVAQYYWVAFGNHAGGTAQTKRMVIATRGLGLPR